WFEPMLQQNYQFFVPAPPAPATPARLVWESEDRCGEVPDEPTQPPLDNIDDLGEGSSIGGVTCGTIPFAVAETTVNNQPGVTVTVKATQASYPANKYVAFARRFKVAWDYVAPAAQQPKAYKVTVNTMRVYDDAEECGE